MSPRHLLLMDVQVGLVLLHLVFPEISRSIWRASVYVWPFTWLLFAGLLPCLRGVRVRVAARCPRIVCVSVCDSQHPPAGQLEGDSPIRAGPVVQRLSAAVIDTELCLSLNNCQSALVHSDPSGSLPLSHSSSPLDSHWQPRRLPEPSVALLSSLASNWLAGPR